MDWKAKLEKLITQLKTKLKKWSPKLGPLNKSMLIRAFVLIFGIVLVFALDKKFSLLDPIREKIIPVVKNQKTVSDAFAEGVANDPYIQEQMAGKSAEEIKRLTQKLSALGVKFLSTDHLILHGELLYKIADQANMELCSKILLGGFPVKEMLRVLVNLPQEDFDAWINISVESAKAALQKPAPPTVTEEQVQIAWEDFAQKIGIKQYERFAESFAMTSQRGKLTDAEGCWMTKTLYGTATNISKGSGDILLRSLVASKSRRIPK